MEGHGNIQSKFHVFVYLGIFLCNEIFGLDCSNPCPLFPTTIGFPSRPQAEGLGLPLSGHDV